MIATSSRSLFPATTTMELSEVFPEQSRWIFGGSGGTKQALGTWLPNTTIGHPEKQHSKSRRSPAPSDQGSRCSPDPSDPGQTQP